VIILRSSLIPALTGIALLVSCAHGEKKNPEHAYISHHQTQIDDRECVYLLGEAAYKVDPSVTTALSVAIISIDGFPVAAQYKQGHLAYCIEGYVRDLAFHQYEEEEESCLLFLDQREHLYPGEWANYMIETDTSVCDHVELGDRLSVSIHELPIEQGGNYIGIKFCPSRTDGLEQTMIFGVLSGAISVLK